MVSAGSLVDAFFNRLGQAIGWMTVLMVGLAFVVVVLRYVFNIGWVGLQESITYLHATCFMLALAWVLGENGHVRVDVLYRRLSHRRRLLVDRIGLALLVLPVAIFVLWTTWPYVASSWRLWEGSREAGGLPLVWLLKSLMPLAAVLLLVQALNRLVRGWPQNAGEALAPE